MINPYHVHVRCKKTEDRDHFVKMSLQLYQVNGIDCLYHLSCFKRQTFCFQVDYKSFLLDFKSLPLSDDNAHDSTKALAGEDEDEGDHGGPAKSIFVISFISSF